MSVTTNKIDNLMTKPEFLQFLKEHYTLLLELFSGADTELKSLMSFEEFTFETWIEMQIS